MPENKLEKVIEKGNLEKSIAFLQTLSPKERRALALPATRLLRKLNDILWDNYVIGKNKNSSEKKNFQDQIRVAEVVVFVTSSLSELKKLGWKAVPKKEHIVRLVKLFDLTWIDDWAAWYIESSPHHFRTVRSLVESGVCKKPDNDAYILGMISALGRGASNETGGLAKVLLSTEDILHVDLWRIFEIEGNGEFSLAAVDKYSREELRWADTLVKLADNQQIDRNRLLDASLDALERDYAQFRAGWFSRFHEALQPTIEERETRLDRYLQLLGSQIPPTVSFTIKAITTLQKQGRAPASALLNHIMPAIEARTKSTVLSALKLIENVAKKESSTLPEVCRLTLSALLHDNVDVQKRALDIIDKYGDTNDARLIQSIKDYSPSIKPSLQNRILKWVKQDTDRDDTAHESHNEGHGADGSEDQSTTAFAAEHTTEAVHELTSYEEFLTTFSVVLEKPGEAIELERVFAWIARFGNEKPSDFEKLSSPLWKRARTIVNRQPDDELQLFIALLAVCYCESHDHFSSLPADYIEIQTHPTFLNIMLFRMQTLIEELVSGKRGAMLATPTDTRGFIAPKVLVDRCKQNQKSGYTPSLIDQVLALLRLAPDDRPQSLNAVKNLEGEFGQALTFALGEDVPIGKTAALWIAAANARNPAGECPAVVKRYGKLGPGAGQKIKYTYTVTSRQSREYTFYDLRLTHGIDVPDEVPIEHVSVLLNLSTPGYRGQKIFGTIESLVRNGAILWPTNLEPYFADAVNQIDVNWSEAQWHVRSFFEPMLDHHVPLGDMATLLIALGLAAKEAGQKGIATDVFIASVADGRLDLRLLSAHMANLLSSGYVIVSRWTKTLADAATVSNQHTKAVCQVIQGALRYEPENPPRDLGGLLELLYESQLTIGEPITDPEAINYIGRLTKGGKIKTYANKLLKLR